MQVKTEAIVLNAIRYADADLIVKMYTKDFGIVSYILKGVLKSKKGKLRSSFFQIGNILEIDTFQKKKNGLSTLKEVKPIFHFKTLHIDVVKGSLITFLFEILNQILVEEQSDQELYQFLYKSLLWLDINEDIALFHVLFLLGLTSFLGCYPDDSNIEALIFDLEKGSFISHTENNEILIGEILLKFKMLLGMKFDDIKMVLIPKIQRKELLNSMLRYYYYHVPGYREPKSLVILEQLFN